MANILISLALQLILAAQKPNVPIELKFNALKTAQIALDYASSHPSEVYTSSMPATEAPYEGQPIDLGTNAMPQPEQPYGIPQE